MINLKNLNTRYYLLAATFIPVLAIALLFTFFYHWQFNHFIKQQTAHLGKAYIGHLLPAAQTAFLKNDIPRLQKIIDNLVINPDIQGLAFYNAKGQRLAYQGRNLLFQLPATSQKLVKIEHVYTYQLLAPIKNLNNDILGWVCLHVDSKLMLIKRYQMLLISLSFCCLSLFLGGLAFLLLSRCLLKPIHRLRNSMKQILQNEFETSIYSASGAELGIIEQGCAHLQHYNQQLSQEWQQSTDLATADLQQSLELLEEKNIQLSMDKKKAEEKNRLKSEFIANLSHEIRTPINGLIGFSNVLLDSSLQPLQLDYVKTIKSSAHDLLTIINDILDYSKMEAGKLHLDNIPLDIRTCLDEILSLNAPYAHKKGLDLIPATATDVPGKLLGDPVRIKQLLSNLVVNAIKFTDQGYVLIRTQVVASTKSDYTLCISVTDTGIGISPQHQSSLFNAFSQIDQTITRRHSGSGLGLVICKKLAEHMQGSISLESEAQKGTTFNVYIKLAKLPAYEAEKHQQHRFAHLKVLCFDDNPLHMEALCNGLGTWGITCIPVSNFALLNDAFTQHPDCQLAFINVNPGFEAQMASLLIPQSIPIVLISKFYIPNYQALGADALLFKPPNLQKLHDSIESLVPSFGHDNKPQTNLAYLRQELTKMQPTLLIAEDNPVNRLLLQSLLKHQAQVTSVNDGSQALALASQKSFDAILLDLQMPHLNGLDAARMIKQTAILNKDTPILLISASHNHFDTQYLREAGINECLQKPIEEKELLQHLLTHLKQRPNSAINWALCIEKVSGNELLAIEFMVQFTLELKKNREEFLALIQTKDIPGLEQLAHKLYGACCFCGVPQLQHQVANLEQQAKYAKAANELKPALEQLIMDIDQVLQDYQTHYQTRFETILELETS